MGKQKKRTGCGRGDGCRGERGGGGGERQEIEANLKLRNAWFPLYI